MPIPLAWPNRIGGKVFWGRRRGWSMLCGLMETMPSSVLEEGLMCCGQLPAGATVLPVLRLTPSLPIRLCAAATLILLVTFISDRTCTYMLLTVDRSSAMRGADT